MTPLRIFRYSGNKARYLHHYRPPPDGTARIIEPYLGSGGTTPRHEHATYLNWPTNPDTLF